MTHNIQHKPLIITLTGGIGSGKTAVSDCFAALGVPVIDTDIISRELVQPGSAALHEISRHFGSTILKADGSLDRTALRQWVFREPQERQWLENLLHPLIRQETLARITELSWHPYIVVVVPLLRGNDTWQEMSDQILVVDVPEEVQIERVATRDGITREAVAAIMRTQLPGQDRLRLADQVIDNTGTTEQLQERVRALHEYYRQLAASKTEND